MPAPSPGRVESAEDAFDAIDRMHQDCARIEGFLRRTSQPDKEYLMDQLRGIWGLLEVVGHRIETEK